MSSSTSTAHPETASRSRPLSSVEPDADIDGFLKVADSIGASAGGLGAVPAEQEPRMRPTIILTVPLNGADIDQFLSLDAVDQQEGSTNMPTDDPHFVHRPKAHRGSLSRLFQAVTSPVSEMAKRHGLSNQRQVNSLSDLFRGSGRHSRNSSNQPSPISPLSPETVTSLGDLKSPNKKIRQPRWSESATPQVKEFDSPNLIAKSSSIPGSLSTISTANSTFQDFVPMKPQFKGKEKENSPVFVDEGADIDQLLGVEKHMEQERERMIVDLDNLDIDTFLEIAALDKQARRRTVDATQPIHVTKQVSSPTSPTRVLLPALFSRSYVDITVRSQKSIEPNIPNSNSVVSSLAASDAPLIEGHDQSRTSVSPLGQLTTSTDAVGGPLSPAFRSPVSTVTYHRDQNKDALSCTIPQYDVDIDTLMSVGEVAMSMPGSPLSGELDTLKENAEWAPSETSPTVASYRTPPSQPLASPGSGEPSPKQQVAGAKLTYKDIITHLLKLKQTSIDAAPVAKMVTRPRRNTVTGTTQLDTIKRAQDETVETLLGVVRKEPVSALRVHRFQNMRVLKQAHSADIDDVLNLPELVTSLVPPNKRPSGRAKTQAKVVNLSDSQLDAVGPTIDVDYLFQIAMEADQQTGDASSLEDKKRRVKALLRAPEFTKGSSGIAFGRRSGDQGVASRGDLTDLLKTGEEVERKLLESPKSPGKENIDIAVQTSSGSTEAIPHESVFRRNSARATRVGDVTPKSPTIDIDNLIENYQEQPKPKSNPAPRGFIARSLNQLAETAIARSTSGRRPSRRSRSIDQANTNTPGQHATETVSPMAERRRARALSDAATASERMKRYQR